jgi:hypothetical protein
MTQKQREPLMDALQRRLKERVVERARLAERQAERLKQDREREDMVAALFKDWLEEHENVILPDNLIACATVTSGDYFDVFLVTSDDVPVELNEEALLSADGQISLTSDSPTWKVLSRDEISEHELFLDAMIVALGLEDEDEAQ